MTQIRFTLLAAAAAAVAGIGAQFFSPAQASATVDPGGYVGTLYQEVGGGGYLCSCGGSNCKPCQ